MCYDDQAQPPASPNANGQARGEDLVLTASDGNRFAAYLATPEQTATAAVLIYPDVRGLFQFYKDLALRFAETGVTALAIDYFGRTAGLTSRDESFEFMPHVQQMRLENFTNDVEAALSYLRDSAGADAKIFAVGFCMGGTLTLLTGANQELGFTGLIPFYPGLSRPIGGQGTALENARRVSYPVLGLFGGADQGIPQDQVQQLDDLLDATGVEHTIIVYPGAPHSFFDRRAAEFAEASSDAWRQIQRFITTHAG
jgi:carboxymethylenebutenolidase